MKYEMWHPVIHIDREALAKADEEAHSFILEHRSYFEAALRRMLERLSYRVMGCGFRNDTIS